MGRMVDPIAFLLAGKVTAYGPVLLLEFNVRRSLHSNLCVLVLRPIHRHSHEAANLYEASFAIS